MSLQKSTMTMEQLLEQLITKVFTLKQLYIIISHLCPPGEDGGGGVPPPHHRRPQRSGRGGHHRGEVGRRCGKVTTFF